jgi:23S rRNA (pseudouridine1915-N3)-methyltransferase
MLKLTVIVAGKYKEDHWRDAEREYLKRLSPYAKINVLELESAPMTSTADAEKSMRMESERILSRIPADATYIVALERTGKRLSSEAFAKLLGDQAEGGAHAVLVIGGAAGLDASVLTRAQAKLSLSDMTFTHEMARVFLMEQLYRASTILAGKAYHY